MLNNSNERNKQIEHNAYIIICFEVDKDTDIDCDMCFRDRLAKKLEILSSEMLIRSKRKFLICLNMKCESADKINDECDRLCIKLEEEPGLKITERDILSIGEHLPSPLYIYKPWNSDTKAMICDNLLFLSDPQNFNDPFDCQMQIYDQGYSISELKKKVGICCLSKRPDNILMWSHYAEKHQGVCIGFDTKILLDFAEQPCVIIPVRYKKEMPSYLDLLDMDKERYLSYKFKDWEYEEEYRILHGKKQNRVICYPPRAIKEIYLGCRMNEEIQKEIEEIIETINKDWNGKCFVKLFKMTAKTNDFKLESNIINKPLSFIED